MSKTSDAAATARCDDGKVASPLDTVRALLATGAQDEVIALVASLVANNAALKRQLEEVSGRRFKTNEKVSRTQLRLLLSELSQPEESTNAGELAKADAELTAAADLEALKTADDDRNNNDKKNKPKKRAAPRPFPAKLRRVAEVLTVPDAERPCPKCGGARVCIGHDVAEVLDREPSEVIVREQRREKLACKNKNCTGSVCRAPLPERVVVGGRLGPRLVSCILVDKYRDGRVPRRHWVESRKTNQPMPRCTGDEGRPLGVGLQDQASNHLELLWFNDQGGERRRKRRDVIASGMDREDERK